jgi:hypothetical protein
MMPASHPLQFLLVALAGWIKQQQREVIEYLQAENRVLREQLGSRRLRFTDDQRLRLAAKAQRVGRRVLLQFRTIVTPDTLLGGIVISSPANMTATSSGADRAGRRRPWRYDSWWYAWRPRIAIGVHAHSRRASECGSRRGARHDRDHPPAARN